MKIKFTKPIKISVIVLYTLTIAATFSFVGYRYGALSQKIAYRTSFEGVIQAAASEDEADTAIFAMEDEEAATYTVRRYADGIGVYLGDELIRIVEIDFFMLRMEDRLLLESGIEANTMQEVNEILEDYISWFLPY